MRKELSGEGVQYTLRASGSLVRNLNMHDLAQGLEVNREEGGVDEEAHYYMEFAGEDSSLQLWFGTEEETREVIEVLERRLD